jgi:hypothetical protein
MKKVMLPVIAACLVASCSGGGGSSVPVHHQPRFQYIPASWFGMVNSIDMGAYWNGAGIPFGGMNYFLLPMPAGGNAWSERFNPDSKYFQAWIGIYTVPDSNGAIYGMQDGVLEENAIAKLGIVDQTHWLMEFGQIPSPVVKLDDTYPMTKEAATIDGCDGWKVACRLTTPADTGDDNMQAGMPALLVVPKSAWEARIASYQPISLDVCLYVWHSAENGELNVIYYNSTRFTDLGGNTVDTKAVVSDELDTIAKSITVR